jgi:hypothetical protein
MLLVLGAFLCVGLGQSMPSADAAPTGDGMTMDMGDGGTMPMPCKGKIPDCYSGIGCIFMVALPPAYTPTATPLAWSRIVYASVTASRAGTSLEPDLGPPIHA